jgi:sterol desaturase/sphingolipid hydroxylase (fatty acid hydroxylase superfamily)
MLFGAEKIPFTDLALLEKSSPNLIIYTLPAVVLFTLLECIYSYFGEHEHYEKKETLAAVLIGIGNLLVGLFMKALLLYSVLWLYNIAPWRMALNWWTLFPCFIVYDFCSYWSHRISHFNRLFWASHVVHHSAEHYNLTVSFRQSWLQHIKSIFFIPAALMGFHPVIFFVAYQLSTLYQFWVHSGTIGKLHPFIEKHFGTPSNHKVHHGSQEKYLDKNFGAAFMAWDHLFGTFQYEEEQPVYGLTTPIAEKINPFVLNFHEFANILKDIRKSSSFKEAWFYTFASPDKVYKRKQTALNQIKPAGLGTEQHTTAAEQLIRIAGAILMILFFFHYAAQAQNVDETILPTPQKTENMLFYLQRDPDINTIIYELNFNPDGSICSKEPVKATWIRYTENGKHQALTNIEKRYAYGIRSKDLGNDEYEIRLAAYKKLPLYLKKAEPENKYRIFIKDEGKYYRLKRVFVRVNGGSFWFPKIRYIDLIAINMGTGKEVLQRINI